MPFVTTLGVQTLTRGILYIATNATPIYGLPFEYMRVGLGNIGPFPIATSLAVVIAVVMQVLLKHTPYGQYVLALGGNAAVIVDKDWGDLDDVVERLVVGAYYQSGQSCISVQRILIHEDIYDELRDRLVKAVSTLKMGDPKDEDTFVGPVISDVEADRMERWINSAVAAGAMLLCGGTRDGRMIAPTLLENVPKSEPAYAEEFFGPMALLAPFSDFDQAIAEVNDSRFGLQAGVFTRDIYKAQKAWDRLDVGGVVIGDVPSWRVDHMPYGGVKDSGIGREGIRYAVEDMSEIRLMVLRIPPNA